MQVAGGTEDLLVSYADKRIPEIDAAMERYLPVRAGAGQEEFNQYLKALTDASDSRFYSLMTLLGSELFGGEAKDAVAAAVAVEFVHASARCFGEAAQGQDVIETERAGGKPGAPGDLSLAAGLALLNAAYPLVFVHHSTGPERSLQAHAEIVECVGTSKAFRGGTHRASGPADSAPDARELARSDNGADVQGETAHIRLALRIGAILAGANYLELAGITRFAEHFGDAYVLCISSAAIGHRRGTLERLDSDDRNSAVGLGPLCEAAAKELTGDFAPCEARSVLFQLVEQFESCCADC